METGAESQDRPEESKSQKHFSGLHGAQQKGLGPETLVSQLSIEKEGPEAGKRMKDQKNSSMYLQASFTLTQHKLNYIVIV